MVGSSDVVSGAQSWFVTAPRGCWLCPTNLPGGNQVDGLPPAPSTGAEYRRSGPFGTCLESIDAFCFFVLGLDCHILDVKITVR